MDFDTFFQESHPEMLARALVLSRSRHDAEDAVQEAYVEALYRWDRISVYENPGAWVYKLVRQRLWRSSKRWARLRSLSSIDEFDRRSVNGDPERFAEAAMALSALAKLPARQRMVMVMHCLHRMEQKQIADELGLTRGSVAASIFKARRKLEKALGMQETVEDTIVESTVDGQAIARKRDPLAASLDTVLFWLRQLASDEGNEQLLDRIHLEAYAREHQSGQSQ